MQFLDSKNPESGSSTEYSATSSAPPVTSVPVDSANSNEAPQGDDYIKDDIPF
jgi:hypothetical protein